MFLDKIVNVKGRFQRSVNILQDSGDAGFLDGYLCPISSTNVLLSLSDHLSAANHSSFTLTGPYGCGKSSLVVACAGLLSENRKLKEAAKQSIGEQNATTILNKIAPNYGRRRIFPVVGANENPLQAIGKLVPSPIKDSIEASSNNGAEIVKQLVAIAEQNQEDDDGLVIFIDEMGKFLEASARGVGDVYFFQQLAEAANRTSGRLLVIGILHQSFHEYSGRLSQEAKREWLKIEGRFVDLSLNISGEEQIELISRAIENGGNKTKPKIAKLVSEEILRRRPGTSSTIKNTLSECWPLHPATTALLAPISKRRFGQNQRSIFGFLNSAEPLGFQNFLQHSQKGQLFQPDHLWDYLKVNLEAAIYSSPDGHRWAQAAEAVERCEASFDKQTVKLAKSIAVLDLFKESSGVFPTEDLIDGFGIFSDSKATRSVLAELQKASIIVFRNYQSAYAVFAGSDFDIDQAIEDELSNVNISDVEDIVSFQPLMAKRHYHTKGSSRWFEIRVSTDISLDESINGLEIKEDVSGVFLLCLSHVILGDNEIQRQILASNVFAELIVGIVKTPERLHQILRELSALANIQINDQRLQGDDIARREVRERIATLRSVLEIEKNALLSKAKWVTKSKMLGRLSLGGMNSAASDICDDRYSKSPFIHNELLNRNKPSSSARGAQNELMRKLILYPTQTRFGIEGFSADRGLFESIIVASGFYQEKASSARIQYPSKGKNDLGNFSPLWEFTNGYLRDNMDRPVALTEIFDIWGKAPYGVKDGMKPLLALLYFLTSREHIALYRDMLFQPTFSDTDAEMLGANHRVFSIRWMNLDASSKTFLSNLASLVRDLDGDNELNDLVPLDVGKGLIAIFDNIHPLTAKTFRLSKPALQLRDVFRNASDPNDLIFGKLKSMNNGADNANHIRDLFIELAGNYQGVVKEIGSVMLTQLGAPNEYVEAIADIRRRAENVKDISGEFKLEAFVVRLCALNNDVSNIEGIASLAIGKPTTRWVDQDADLAKLEVMKLARRFNELETFALLKNRTNNRSAFTVMRVDATGEAKKGEFSILDGDKQEVSRIVKELTSSIDNVDVHDPNLMLAALSEICNQYIDRLQGDTINEPNAN